MLNSGIFDFPKVMINLMVPAVRLAFIFINPLIDIIGCPQTP
jgi:hypothetical protein